MYLWIGCKLPEEFEREIRPICLSLNESVGMDTMPFLLPQHISLKISFQTDRPEEILDDLESYLKTWKPFSVRVLNAERAENILWMPVAENSTLQQLHEELDRRLETKFSIPQHEFDKCFLFHSTLFMDEDVQKLDRMAALLEDHPFERELQVDTFLLGGSESGRLGTCHILREIKV